MAENGKWTSRMKDVNFKMERGGKKPASFVTWNQGVPPASTWHVWIDVFDVSPELWTQNPSGLGGHLADLG